MAEAAALTATANKIIQDADSVGTALKTTSLRLRGTDISVLEEEGVDSEGAVTSKSKLQSKVKALSGVDILTQTGEYKSTYEILVQIADVWESMNDMDQAALLELIAGKRNSSVVAALLQNPEELKAAYEDAQNASGSALRENEKYLDSIQGKIDQFNNAVQSMWSNSLNSDWIKNIVEFGTELIKIVDDVGLFNVALVGLGTYLSTKYMQMDFAHPIKSFKQIFGKPAVTSVQDMQSNLEKLQQTYDEAFAEWKADPTQETRQGLINAKSNLQEYKQELDDTIQTTSELEDAQKHLAHAQNDLDNYKGNDPKKLYKYRDAVDRAQKKVDALNESQQRTTKTGSSGWQKLGVKVDGFTQKVQSAVASMLVMYAISKIMSLIGDLWDQANETAEEAKESFETLSSELSKTKSELSSLESQLNDIQSQIEDINDNTPLTFTDREELSRLEAQSAELQRQIDLLNTIKEQQAIGVNSSAINAVNKYEQTGVKTGKTAGENVGGKALGGAGIGAGLGVATGVGGSILSAVGAGTALGSWAGPIGMLIGAAIGAIAGAAIGAAVGGIQSASEKTVGESLDNMKSEYEKLQSEYETARAEYMSDADNKKKKKKFEEAQEAFNTYRSNMANYMTEMDSYYSQIKQNWDQATDAQKQEYIEWRDTTDAWAIQSGGANAKTNAIARIFGDEASDELKEIKKRMQEAAEAGEKISLADAFNGDEKAYNVFKTRLYDIGLTVYETEQYFKDEQKAAEEAIDAIETYDAIKQIQKLTSGVNDLKHAFKELHEEGIVSAGTLLGLEEQFGKIDGWKEFFEVISSGTTTMEEAQDAAKILAENYVEQILSSGALSHKEYITAINHLQSLGITNAKDFLDAKIKKNMATDIAQRVKNGATQTDAIKAVEEEYEIKLDGENDRLLVEKQITAEKAKQDALDKQAAKNAYDAAVSAQGVAKDKNEYIDTQINALSSLSSIDLQEMYGVGLKTEMSGWGSNSTPTTNYYYNGKRYTSLDKVKEVIAADLLSSKVKVPELPVEVTEIDVTNANDIAETAANNLQEELNKHGLTLEIDLVGFDERVDKIQDVYSTLKNIATEYNAQGYLSLDNLQALLQLTPEYLSVLKMENGQITINQQALEEMLQTKLAEAEATAVQTAITQLSALAERKQAIEISNSAVAANQASIELGTYSSMLGTVAQDAIIAAGSVTAFNNALRGAQDNAFVSDDEINQILSNFNNSVDLINSVRDNLPSSFNNILDPGSQTSPDKVADDRFQKAMEYWENRIGANQSLYEQIQNDIDLLEKQGKIAGTSYYAAQINVEEERLQHLKAQREEARGYLDDFEVGSDKWWEVANKLNDIEGEIDDVTMSIQDLSDAMDQVRWDMFDEAHDRFGDLTNQLSNVRELLSADEDSFFNDEGEWTETGVAVLATHIQEIELYKNALADVNKELADIDIGDFDSEQEYYDKLTELTNQQHDYTMEISDSEQSVVDMYESSIDAIEEYTQTLVDNYNDYIDSVKEALDAERDLYDFKKNVQKQSKDIAEIERRIMSLSGSTNAADIAERRRLEADLYGAREELDDTYYNHAKESQQNALDAEAEAYEESITRFVEGLRTSFEEATANMDEFLMGVTSMVTLNAEAVLNKYESTQLPLSTALTNPWEAAKIASNTYSGDALALMNEWTKDGSIFAKFNTSVEMNLTSPWGAGKIAAQDFGASIQTTMSSVYTSISSNVQNSITELNKLKQKYDEINDTDVRVDISNGGGSGDNGGYVAPKQYYVTASVDVENKKLSVTRVGATEALAKSAAKIALNGEYAKLKGTSLSAEMAWLRSYYPKIKTTTDYYAKGTIGTKRDAWAITDEPQFGDELVLVPGKDGNLSFMRKGSSVVPADLAANLMEWGQFTPDSMGLGNGVNVNMINNAVNKPEFNFTFDALVKAEHIDENTLPEVKKFVQQEINSLVKQMNYAIKGKGGR